MKTTASRRDFLRTASAGAVAATLSASSYARVVGANDRISIGMIGCGRMGREGHMAGVQKHAKTENVEITAVCDPWRRAPRGGVGAGRRSGLAGRRGSSCPTATW